MRAGWSPRGTRRRDPLGVVLAGGLGRRIGGAKAMVKLDGRPLLTYSLEAVWRALGSVTVVAKRDSELPSLRGVEVWVEPDLPRHPLAGIVHALHRATGRPVLVCPGDLPLISAELLRRLAREDPGDAPAVVASDRGCLEPLLGCYHAPALAPLTAALADETVSAREAVTGLNPRLVEVEHPEELLNVNRPEDLLRAAAAMDRRGRISRT